MKLLQSLFAALITAAFVPNLAAAAGTGLPQMVTKELVALDKQREKELATSVSLEKL